MFRWLFGWRDKKLERKTEQAFSAVRKDMDSVGKWLKHLDGRDKQLFDMFREFERDLSSVKNEIDGLREGLLLIEESKKNKQVFEKQGVYDKQTAVWGVGKAVQTAVQTANFYDILKNLSSNERALVFTIMNSEMKLSYEDLALLLGKEKSTIRGQVNSIKQKSEGILEEISEKNGKKRVFVPEETKEKLLKYAKVRVSKNKKVRVNDNNSEKEGIKNEN